MERGHRAPDPSVYQVGLIGGRWLVAVLLCVAPHAHALVQQPAHALRTYKASPCRSRNALKGVQSSAVEEAFVQGGRPLLATPNDSRASEVLKKSGVVRINGVLDPDLCLRTRQRILELTKAIDAANTDDLSFVPGTRLRFEKAVQLPMDGKGTTMWTRNDVLLPLEDDLVANALRNACCKLENVLSDGAVSNLPGDAASGLELVELAALIARSGAGHQMLHADFRRDEDFSKTIAALGGQPLTTSAVAVAEDDLGIGEDIWAALEADTIPNTATPPPSGVAPAAPSAPLGKDETKTNPFGQMPPRLVTFIYLQGVPTSEHGATVFLPGTANAEAHDKHLGSRGPETSSPKETSPQRAVPKPVGLLRLKDVGLASSPYAPPPPPGPSPVPGAVIATLNTGDAVVFDASVLHFGGANSVPDNDRVLLYFGFARNGAAADFDGGAKVTGATEEDERQPIPMSRCLDLGVN